MSKIKNWDEFINEGLSNLQKEYREYFRFMLDLYEIKSPSALSEEKKKDFFNNVSKYWVKGKGASKELDKIAEEITGKKITESIESEPTAQQIYDDYLKYDSKELEDYPINDIDDIDYHLQIIRTNYHMDYGHEWDKIEDEIKNIFISNLE